MKTSNINSPVARAWAIYNAMTRKGVAPARGKAIAKAVAEGVAPGTAATQYHAWLRAANAALKAA